MKRALWIALVAGGLLGSVGAGLAAADTIVDTGTPDGGFFGYIGYDVFVGQSVGLAFTPTANYRLDDVGVWFMSNDFDNPGRTYTLSLRENVPGSNNGMPAPTAIETWNMATAAVGWLPVLDVATSVLHPTLQAGTQYWIYAESNEQPFVDPVWVWGSSFDPYVSGELDLAGGTGWNSGITYGSAPGALIHGTLVPEPMSATLLALVALVARRRTA
jgi:hypothetical protein